MKTAMQELISELKRVDDYPMMPFVIRIATDLLEKEKEQIIDSFDYGYHCASNGTSAEITLDGEINYNQTYNQTNDK